MKESSYKIPGGKLVKIKLLVSSERITDVKILGDFFLHPEETLMEIEESLVGQARDESSITRAVNQALTDSEATLIGCTAADIAKSILMAWDSSSSHD